VAQSRANRWLAAAIALVAGVRLAIALVPAQLIKTSRRAEPPMRHVINPPAAPFLTNGAMSEGSGTPQGWHLHGSGRLARDITTFRSAPASLRLDCSGAVTAQTELVEVNGPFRIAGWARVQGDPNGEIGIDIVAWGKHQAWISVAHLPSQTGGWVPFAQNIVLPSIACNEYATVRAHGSGRIWLDDLTLTRIGK
jgi:hypothetical protein